MKLDSYNNGKSVNVKAPAVFYPDRYMSSCRELARELRTKRLRVQEEIQQLEALMTRYTTPQNVKGNLTIKELLAKAAAATSVALSTTQANETDLIETETSTEKADLIAKELLEISDRIDSKLKGIVQAIEEIRSPSANH
jgi:dihydrodipicolinate synthase/N-acetylneuraminate lyase